MPLFTMTLFKMPLFTETLPVCRASPTSGPTTPGRLRPSVERPKASGNGLRTTATSAVAATAGHVSRQYTLNRAQMHGAPPRRLVAEERAATDGGGSIWTVGAAAPAARDLRRSAPHLKLDRGTEGVNHGQAEESSAPAIGV